MFFLQEGFSFRNFLIDAFTIFVFIIWFWLMIVVVSDLFRRHELSGWGKAIWIVASRCPVCPQQRPNGGHSKTVENVPLADEECHQEIILSEIESDRKHHSGNPALRKPSSSLETSSCGQRSVIQSLRSDTCSVGTIGRNVAIAFFASSVRPASA